MHPTDKDKNVLKSILSFPTIWVFKCYFWGLYLLLTGLIIFKSGSPYVCISEAFIVIRPVGKTFLTPNFQIFMKSLLINSAGKVSYHASF